MNKYTVVIEVRERGAQGYFHHERREVEAVNALQARDAAFWEMQTRGFETRNADVLRDGKNVNAEIAALF